MLKVEARHAACDAHPGEDGDDGSNGLRQADCAIFAGRQEMRVQRKQQETQRTHAHIGDGVDGNAFAQAEGHRSTVGYWRFSARKLRFEQSALRRAHTLTPASASAGWLM